MRIAFIRDVSPALDRCELSHLPRSPIDVDKARRQHRRYAETLAELGCRVESLPSMPEQADAVFVEDTAVVVDELAVITRPGAESRRSEVDSSAAALARYKSLAYIEPPGTLDGGDVLQVGRTLFVGLSARSNQAGIEQLRAHLRPHRYRVEAVALKGCLHLKTAATQVGQLKTAATEVAPGVLLINPDWVDKSAFPGMEIIEVDPSEPFAANAVLVGDAVVYPASHPRTRERLEKRGLDVRVVDMSETEKAEGGVTCCSLLFQV
ncbi:MAG TPA: arginine deiminase family protein [Gammaproteobacteria bacterium]|nr:arginine deiminase family protein [Gammaproteobacteria bacterium]